MEHLVGTRQVRAGLARLVAQRNHVVPRFVLVDRDRFGAQPSGRDTSVVEHSQRQGIDPLRGTPGAPDKEAVATLLAQQSLGHDAPSGITDAQKQNADGLRVAGSMSQRAELRKVESHSRHFLIR